MDFISAYILKWTKWQRSSTNREIFGSMVTITLLMIFAKSISAVKDVGIANYYGTSIAFDAFLTAFVLPYFIVNVFAGSFHPAIIPILVKQTGLHGENASRELFAKLTFFATLVLVLTTIFLVIFAPWLINLVASGFDAEKKKLVLSLFYQLVPLVILSGLPMFWSAALNARKGFKLVSLTPILTPIIILLALKFYGYSSNPKVLVWGTLIGAFVEFIVIGVGVWRIGYLFFPIPSRIDANSKNVFHQYLPMIGGAFIFSGSILVDQVMASWLEPGSLAALNYGNKITSLIVGFSATALGTAVLPYLSQLVVNKDIKALKHCFYTYSKLILIASIPLTLLGYFFSYEIIKFIFERGVFDTSATIVVTQIQQCFLLQVPFYILGILEVRLISSFSANHIISRIAVINFIINIIGNFLLIKVMGIAGIALSTSIVYIASTAMCYFAILKLFRDLEKDIHLNT